MLCTRHTTHAHAVCALKCYAPVDVEVLDGVDALVDGDVDGDVDVDVDVDVDADVVVVHTVDDIEGPVFLLEKYPNI